MGPTNLYIIGSVVRVPMVGSRVRAGLGPIVAVLGILVLSTMLPGVGAAGHLGPAARPSAPAPAEAPRTPAVAPAPPASAPTSSPAVERVANQIAAHRFNGADAFLPSPFVARAEPVPGSTVAPSPLTSPAPMGLTDLGLGVGGGAYAYNTTRFEGTVRLASFAAFSPGYAEFDEAPDWTSIQLNVVGTNLSIPGLPAATFWLQNVARFNGTELQLVDNVWNFSSVALVLPPGTLSGNGSVQLDEFYFDNGPTFTVTYPFSLTLSVALELIGGHAAALFNVTLSDGAGTKSQTYDTVVFGALEAGAPALEVNGYTYNPFGDEYDAELVFGGNGGGSNANIVAMDGNATLERWDAIGHRFVSVPSAYDHGVDTGESSEGIAIHYLPHTATAYLVQGPSFLYGLWNTSSGSAGPAARPGWIQVQISLTPSFGFLFATDHDSSLLPLARANYSFAPTTTGGVATTQLPPNATGDPYNFAAWADGFASGSTTVSSNATGTSTLALVAAPGTLDAPVYLRSDAQATAFGGSGIASVGYATVGPGAGGPMLWVNTSSAGLVAPFLRLNDLDYPTFVLFAADRLNVSVRVDDFTQTAGTFAYTTPYPGSTPVLPGWTQGYYFFDGQGRFSVANTTLTGNSTLFYNPTGSIAAPGAVEFFGTHDAQASRITTSQDTFGVALINSADGTFSAIVATLGANGVSVVNSTATALSSISALGTDYAASASIGAYLVGATGVVASQISATNGSYGVTAIDSSGLTISQVDTFTAVATHGAAIGLNLTGVTTATVRNVTALYSDGILATNSSHLRISDLNATGSPYAGYFQNVTDVAVDQLTSADFSVGVDFVNSSGVSVSNVSASGGSTAIGQFDSSTGGTFSNVSSVNGSFGLQATASSHVTISGFSAVNASLDVALANTSFVTATTLSAANLSNALVWQYGANGAVANVTAGLRSLGVDISNVTNVSVEGVNASESALPPVASFYFQNPLTSAFQPTAAVDLANDTDAAVSGVVAEYYPYGVLANFTNASTIDGVSAWYGAWGVALNHSVGTTVAGVFAYGNLLGVFLTNDSSMTLTGSTIEASTSYGLVIQNGSAIHVESNNFVANNGANTKGTYSGTHIQVESYDNATRIYFNSSAGVGNFWSDHSGASPYIVHTLPTTVEDHDPIAAFITDWVEFDRVGLPALTPWGFSLLGLNYHATATLVYLPTSVLPATAIQFAVLNTTGYVAVPTSGTVPAFSGSDRTVTIVYSALHTVTFAETGLPAGRSWSVTLGTKTNTTTSDTIGFVRLNGSYPYTIGAEAGWNLGAGSPTRTGTVTVAGADVSEKTATWVQVTYAVTFTAHGLSGTPKWTVTINGSTTKTSSGLTVVFNEPNGTFTYAITSPSGYSTTGASGSVTVTAGPTGVSVYFNATRSPSGGSSLPWTYLAIGAGIAVVAIAAVAIALRRRRGPRPRARPKKTESGADFDDEV